MKHLNPRDTKLQKVTYELPAYVIKLVNEYAKFCHKNEEEVVTYYLTLMSENPLFVNYVQSLRNNKRLLKDVLGDSSRGNILGLIDTSTILQDDEAELLDLWMR